MSASEKPLLARGQGASPGIATGKIVFVSDEAVKLADRILTIDKNNRVARLVAGVRSLKLKQYAIAQQNINQSV